MKSTGELMDIDECVGKRKLYVPVDGGDCVYGLVL